MRVDRGPQQRTARIRLEPEDGWMAVVIHGGAINSVGAGPSRTMLDRYRWSGSELISVEHQLDPSPWLIHTIYDGLDAHAAALYDVAIERFQAATDETLQTWRSYIAGRPDAAIDEEMQERRELRSFARFRLASALLARDRTDSTAVRQMPIEVERDDAESAYGPVSELFWQAMDETKSLAAACSRVQEYVAQHPPTLRVLNTFGYGNRELTAADICPA